MSDNTTPELARHEPDGMAPDTSRMADEIQIAESPSCKATTVPLPVITFWSAVAVNLASSVLLNACSGMLGYVAIVADIAMCFCCSWAVALSGLLTGMYVATKRCSVVQLVIQLPVFGCCVYFLSQFLTG